MSRSESGTPVMSGSWLTTRYSSAGVGPSPNGLRAVAAYTRVAPRENMSVSGPTRTPEACSGDMKPGEPITVPAVVSAVPSVARVMPKSMTYGPSRASSTFAGLRSRWMIPARCTAVIASARPAVRVRKAGSGSAPKRLTASPKEMPAMNAVANQGTDASVSESTTAAVKAPETDLAASISLRNRWRNCESSASSGRTALTATVRPPVERPR